MRLVLFALLWTAVFAQAVLSTPTGRFIPALAENGLELDVQQSASSVPTMRKRMDSMPDDWASFYNHLKIPDRRFRKETDQDVLRQKYGHLIFHDNMPVFAAGNARAEARLMQHAWADFGAVQVYGSRGQSSRNPQHKFQVSKFIPSDGVYAARPVEDHTKLLDGLDRAHHLEGRFGPHIKLVMMGLPLETRGNGRFGGHSKNKVWKATVERLSSYGALDLREKLNQDRYGLFSSHDGQHLLAITIGNNGLAQMEERVTSLGPVFEAGSRRF